MLAGHKMILAVAILALPLAVPPDAAADPQTFIYLWSDPGDFVGGGQTYYRDLSNGRFYTPNAFDRDGDGLADYVEFFWLGNTFGEFVTLQFGTNELPGTDLAPGRYKGAQRAPLASAGHAGVAVGMDGRGCNTLRGKLTIIDAQFDYSSGQPQVVSFAASFTQHCEGMRPALHGLFYYNYDPGP
jgi:hypothetical protein